MKIWKLFSVLALNMLLGTADTGPTNIHVNLANTTDSSKDLTVDNQLTIIG